MLHMKFIATLCLYGVCYTSLVAQSGLEDLKIAYNVLHDRENDDYEVYVMNPDGSGKRNISNSKGVDWVYFAFADKIYFISDRDTCHRCYFLYEMDANGDNSRRVADFRLRDSWISSRNHGQELIVHPHPKVDSVFRIIDLQGNVLHRLSTGLAYANDPFFSPDGSQVVFRGSTKKFKKDAGYLDELYLINSDGSGLRQLTSYPAGDTTAKWWNYHAGPPFWDAHSDVISFNSVQQGKGSLFAIRPDGSDFRRITNNTFPEDWHTWSPDSRFMVFSGSQANERIAGDNYDIYLFDKKANITSRLTTDTLTEQAPVFVQRKTTIPDWALDDWKKRCSGSGHWLAENGYKNEQEPNDAYGLHWQYGPDKQSIKGRLYGMVDGREGATYWEFLIFWDAAEQVVKVIQTGSNGMVGLGALACVYDGAIKMQQRFAAPDGTVFYSGHLENWDAGMINSRSFDIVAGKWIEKRQYIWKKK